MINVEIVANAEIMKFFKENPLDNYEILLTLLEDDTNSIDGLIKHKEDSLLEN